jgi:hypothetical protein
MRESSLILSLCSHHSQIQWSTSRDVVPVLNSLFKYDRTAEADCTRKKVTEKGAARDQGRAKRWGNGS